MVFYHPSVFPKPGSLTISFDPFCVKAIKIVNVVLVGIIRKGSDIGTYSKIELVCVPQLKDLIDARRLSSMVRSQWRQLLHNLKLIEKKVNIGTSLDQPLTHVASRVVSKSPQRRKR